MPATKFKLLGVILLFAVFNSQALTLGGIRGAATVGQGLDVAIPVQLDPSESSANLCFDGDVFHGDIRQEPGRVKVSVEPAQTAQTFNVRVVSTSVVDEPIVTIYLRVGCENKITRRYSLLADVVAEQLVPVTPRTAQVPLVQPANTPASTAVPNASGSPGASGAGNVAGPAVQTGVPAARRAVAQRRTRPVAAAKPASATAAPRKQAPVKAAAPAVPPPAIDEKLQAGRAAGQSRLKLDPLEVLSERVATLESSTASAPAPAELAARDARDAQRLQQLEASVKNLLTVATRNEASLADMRARLQLAESERYQNPLVYGLILLLLACLAAIVFLVTRRGRALGAGGGNWWSGSVSGAPTISSPETSPATARQSGFAPMSAPSPLAGTGGAPAGHEQTRQQTQQLAPRAVQAPVTQVDVSLVEMSESTFDRLMQSGATHSGVRKTRSTEPAELAPAGKQRSINSEELFDIRQQAEFFVSLGQTDQAVRILESRISEHGESSPLAYLDLLKIFHSLGLRADFRQVREDFNLLFNARVPEFSSFNDEGRGLEDYPDVIAEIVASWGSPAVFAAIELCLFRDQWKTKRELFDLAAFRDLLLLHAVAQSAAAPQDSSFGSPAPRADYPTVPVVAAYRETGSGDVPGRSGNASAEMPLPTIEGAPELDIDLSDLHIPRPVLATPPLEPKDGEQAMPSGAGNLIDFDLSDSQTKGLPKPGE